MRRTGSWLILGTLITLATALPARAILVGVYRDPIASDCMIQAPPLGGVTHAYVLVRFNVGITGTQFKIDLPPCSPYTLLSWTIPPGIISLGNPVTGIQISPGGCMVGDFVALDLLLQRTGDATGCCPLRLLPHPESVTGEVEIVDCALPEGHFVSVTANAAWLSGDSFCAPPVPAPSDPVPADGATVASTEVVLRATVHDPEFTACPPLHADQYFGFHFGTNPSPPLYATPMFPELRVTGLAPMTTYYWRVAHGPYGGGFATSPVWSFTTTNATPVTTSTWGAIKALYR